MPVQLVTKGKSVREQVSAAEWQARIELAAGHRVLAHYGVNDLTYNHFGLRVPGEPDRMLIKRTDWMFSEVTASSLLKVDFDGNVVTDTDVERIKGGALIIIGALIWPMCAIRKACPCSSPMPTPSTTPHFSLQ